MLENRSFDHMLGYLRLSGRRPELDGLTADMANTYHDHDNRFPVYDSVSFPVHELATTKMKKTQDPPHGGHSVDNQLKNKNGGFVQVYMDERGGDPLGGGPRLLGSERRRRARRLVRRAPAPAVLRLDVHPAFGRREASERLVDRPQLRRLPDRGLLPVRAALERRPPAVGR